MCRNCVRSADGKRLINFSDLDDAKPLAIEVLPVASAESFVEARRQFEEFVDKHYGEYAFRLPARLLEETMNLPDPEVLFTRQPCPACNGTGLWPVQMLFGYPVLRSDGRPECAKCNGEKTLLVPLSAMLKQKPASGRLSSIKVLSK